MKYKLIISDYDDTLARDDLTVSPRTLDAIREYERLGGKFVIATGRAPRSAIDIAKSLGLKGPVVCFQGAEVCDIESERSLFKVDFAPEVSSKICKYLEDRGLYCQIFQGDDFIADRISKYGDNYKKECGLQRVIVDMPLSRYILANNIHTGKVLLIDEPNNSLALMNEVKEAFGDVCNCLISKPHLVEIAPKGVSKAVGATKVAELLGVDKSEVICVGDSYNDIPMIEWAGMGVAVENAWDEVKSASDVIVPSNENDGVGILVEKYGIAQK